MFEITESGVWGNEPRVIHTFNSKKAAENKLRSMIDYPVRSGLQYTRCKESKTGYRLVGTLELRER